MWLHIYFIIKIQEECQRLIVLLMLEIINMRKGFDKDTYNKYDSIAKNALSSWLELNGYKDIDSKETYGVDIICKD